MKKKTKSSKRKPAKKKKKGGLTPRIKTPDRHRVPEPDYLEQLHALLDAIFQRAQSEYGWSWPELATESGLAYTTVRKLGLRETQFPELRSVLLLAEAVERPLTLQQVRIAKRARRAA